jgi:hypothetical protein
MRFTVAATAMVGIADLPNKDGLFTVSGTVRTVRFYGATDGGLRRFSPWTVTVKVSRRGKALHPKLQ